MSRSDLPDLERGSVESVRCQASKAHALITDAVERKTKWIEVDLH